MRKISRAADAKAAGTDPGMAGPAYVKAEDYIAGIPMWTRKKNSLSDIREFLAALDVREKNIIHVAGTNGKGSVCAYLTSILKTARFSVGTFISPHLSDIKERFLIDGTPVGEEDFCHAFERVLAVVDEKRAQGFAHPSYFEFCFLMAMTLFTEKDVDYTVLETGLGGRLDATNSVEDVLACVITSISLDHTQYLGDTIEEIAAEKAGIIRPGVPVIYDASDETAAAVIAARAKDMGAPAYPVRACAVASGKEPESAECVILPDGLTFSAPYQRMNAALAVKTMEVLDIAGVTPDTVREGIASSEWQGRMERIRPDIWLDGAHNPGGVSAFIAAVKDQERSGGPFRVHLLFACADDKDYPRMIHLICRELAPSQVTVTEFEGGRAAGADELGALFKTEGAGNVKVIEKPEKALTSAMSDLELSGGNARLYILGSLYLVGELRRCLV